MRSIDRRLLVAFAAVLAAMTGAWGQRAGILRGAEFGQTIRASVATGGAEANGESGNDYSVFPSISADGRYAVFDSLASNLVTGDTNGGRDVFVRDLWGDTTERVSVSTGGAQGNDESAGLSASADGHYVAFHSLASNLVPGDTNGTLDVFVHDLWGHTTERVSVATGGAQGNGWSEFPSISADGRYVAFGSDASNLVPGDTNGIRDIFVHDLWGHTTERVSVATGGAQGNGLAERPSISADGRDVAFASDASNLVPGDTNGIRDVFVRHLLDSKTELVSVATGGAQGNGVSSFVSISADGHYVAFRSDASNLVPGDTNGTRDVFVRDLLESKTELVSVATGGALGNGVSTWPSISADGRFVAFRSDASNLVLGDTNGVRDVFVRDRLGDATERVSVATCGAEGNGASGELSISADGRYVVFDSSASNLVGDDTNGSIDIFVRDRYPDQSCGTLTFQLPFAWNEEWLIGGRLLHNAWGSPAPRGALDFIPPNDYGDCDPDIALDRHVRAIGNGVVASPALDVHDAYVTEIDHGSGLHSFYLHVANPTLAPKDRAATGQDLGNPSCKGGLRGDMPHVHFALRKNGGLVDLPGQIVMCGWEILPEGTVDPVSGRPVIMKRGTEYRGAWERVGCRPTNSNNISAGSYDLAPGQHQLISISVPEAELSAGFFTAWKGSTFSTTLTRPDGTTVDEGDSGVQHFVGDTYDLYEIVNPQMGLWQMDVAAIAVAPGGEMVSTSVDLKRCWDVAGGSVGDPCIEDDDDDAIIDNADNCPLTANPDQLNTDAGNDAIGLDGGDTSGDACDADDDGDGCTDTAENGLNQDFGGQRDPLSVWDFFDVNGDGRVDLNDTLDILAHFGHGTNDDPLDNLMDRMVPDGAQPWQTAEDTSGDGIDLTDALINLESFGHDCSGLP